MGTANEQKADVGPAGDEADGGPEERVLVLAPLGRDAELACEMLGRAGFSCRVSSDIDGFCRELEAGATAALVTEEALATVPAREKLLAVLEAQPTWSDIPLALLVRRKGETLQGISSLYALAPSHNVTILERPVPVSTLTSVIQAAVRARRRQYEVRDHLRQQARQAAELEQARNELEARVDARTAELTYTNAILEEQVEVRERAEAQLRRRNKEVSTLNMITAAASSSLELPDVLTTLRDMLSAELGIAGGIVFFYDEERDELELHYSWGLPTTVRGWGAPFAIKGTHFETVVHRKNSVYRPDVGELSLYAAWQLNETRPRWRNYLCVPLLAQGRIQGAFSLFSERHAFNNEQRAFYITLGQQIGVAINNARLYAEVLNRGERLQQLAQRIISVQEEERHRVSRELHDEAGQALTALMLSLEMTKSTLPREMKAIRESLDEAVKLTGETMEQIRLLAHDLRTPSLDTIGLSPTLNGLCSDFGSRSHLEIEYQGTELPRLSDMIAISLYRVAQEALTNVARHSEATNVHVSLAHENGVVILTIADDGIGFDPYSVLYEASEGIGLPGLQERMETLGGWLEITSSPGGGTQVAAHVPLDTSSPEPGLEQMVK